MKNLSSKTEKLHPQLFNILKEEGYITKNIIKKDNSNLNKDNKIFEFGLKYLFNVVLRIALKNKDRNYIPILNEMMKLYIENDINKAKFILEEFRNAEIINEYLIYCPTNSGITITYDIINFSFKSIFEKTPFYTNKKSNEINEDLCFLFKFINTYVLFISYNIKSISIENVNYLFYKIIKTSPIFPQYLKKRKLEKWIMSFYTDDDDEDEDEELYLNSILSEEELPKLKSDHKILAERVMNFDGVKIDNDENENEFDMKNMNRFKDTSENLQLIQKLFYDFQKLNE